MTLKKAKHFWFSSRATSLRVNYKECKFSSRDFLFDGFSFSAGASGKKAKKQGKLATRLSDRLQNWS